MRVVVAGQRGGRSFSISQFSEGVDGAALSDELETRVTAVAADRDVADRGVRREARDRAQVDPVGGVDRAGHDVRVVGGRVDVGTPAGERHLVDERGEPADPLRLSGRPVPAAAGRMAVRPRLAAVERKASPPVLRWGRGRFCTAVVPAVRPGFQPSVERRWVRCVRARIAPHVMEVTARTTSCQARVGSLMRPVASRPPREKA